MLKHYLTKGDVSKVANVSPQTVNNWMEDGRITPVGVTGIGIKLFDPKRVERYLSQRAKAAARK